MVLPMQPSSDLAPSKADVTQTFFESLALEIRRPAVGEHYREYTRQLLMRAQELGLYQPTKEQK